MCRQPQITTLLRRCWQTAAFVEAGGGLSWRQNAPTDADAPALALKGATAHVGGGTKGVGSVPLRITQAAW